MKTGIDFEIVSRLAQKVKECVDLGVQIAIVVGGGNFWRGRSGGKMDRTRADHMGMLATALNALAIADGLEQLGVETRCRRPLKCRQIAEPYIRNKAVRHLEKGRVVVFGCGTGNPSSRRIRRRRCARRRSRRRVFMKATNVDGVYTADPRKDPAAKKLDTLRPKDLLDQGLGVMDSTAASLCMDNKIPILVFAISDPDNIVKAIKGEKNWYNSRGGKDMKDTYPELTEKMDKTLSVLEHNYSVVRAGRANPGLLDKVRVDYYGTETPINQMAAISVTEARAADSALDVSTLREIEKAINQADLGINPTNDGKVIRLVFPR